MPLIISYFLSVGVIALSGPDTTKSSDIYGDSTGA
jgi:hypothetical protein